MANKKKKVEFKTKSGKKISFVTSGKKKDKKKDIKLVKKKKIEIRTKVFPQENKGRRGEYYYIKEKQKKPKYYKKKEGITEEDIKEYYKRGITSKRGGVSKVRLKKERRLDRVAKKYPKIDDIIEKGYAEYTIKNAKNLTPARLRESYKFLLMNKDEAGDKKSIVRDKELLDLITREENIDKWKHRVLFEVQVKNENGDVLTIIRNNSIKLLGEIKSEVIDQIHIGQEYERQYNVIGTIKDKGYTISSGNVKEGKVKEINIKMIFRKSGR